MSKGKARSLSVRRCIFLLSLMIMIRVSFHFKVIYHPEVNDTEEAILIIFGLAAQLTLFAHAAAYPFGSKLISNRIATSKAKDMSADKGYLDYQSGVRYDEYPIVVPKRAALILDRILKEIESAKDSNQLINDWSPISRRGNNKDKLYFRCYFNAVSCYRRK